MSKIVQIKSHSSHTDFYRNTKEIILYFDKGRDVYFCSSLTICIHGINLVFALA